MRREVGIFLIGLGAFLVTAGLIFRFWSAPQLIAAPLDQYSVVEAEATNATYFDIGELEERTGQTVHATSTVRGDVSKGTSERAVWEQYSVLIADDGTADGVKISENIELAAIDRVTGEAINCCGEHVQEDTDVQHKGLVFKWPFGAEKKTYQLWDARAQRNFDARFAGTENIGGVEAYRYEADIDNVAVDERKVPARLLGRDAKEGDIDAELIKDATRTYWIEPVSGAPVKVSNRERQALVAKEGEGEQVMFEGDIVYTDKQVKASVDTAKRAMTMVDNVNLVPLAAAGLGGLLIVVGGVIASLRRPRHARSASAEYESEIPGGELPDARHPDNGVRP